MSTMRSPAVLCVLVLLGACDRLITKDATTTATPSATSSEAAPVAAAPSTPTAAAALVASAAPSTPASSSAAAPDCAALTSHVHALISSGGSALARKYLPSVEEMRTTCAGEANDPELARCFMAATDTKGLDDCNRKPFMREIDATPKRSFSALKDNSKVLPKILTEDGDYLAYDDECGSLYKEQPPAAAVFIACKGKVQIGPLVNADEVDQIFRKLSADEQRRHEIVMSLIAKTATGMFTVPVHVYDTNGAYRGIEYR